MPSETTSSGKHLSLCFQWTSAIAYPESDAHFWDTIFSADTTSAEVLSNIVAIMHSPTKVLMARGLRGEKAQSFIDLINRVGGQAKLPLVLRVLIMKYSFSLRHPTLIRNSSGGVRGCFTRFVKPAGFYPPHTAWNQSPLMLATLGGAGALRM